jgi:hypothetical protein
MPQRANQRVYEGGVAEASGAERTEVSLTCVDARCRVFGTNVRFQQRLMDAAEARAPALAPPGTHRLTHSASFRSALRYLRVARRPASMTLAASPPCRISTSRAALGSASPCGAALPASISFTECWMKAVIFACALSAERTFGLWRRGFIEVQSRPTAGFPCLRMRRALWGSVRGR